MKKKLILVSLMVLLASCTPTNTSSLSTNKPTSTTSTPTSVVTSTPIITTAIPQSTGITSNVHQHSLTKVAAKSAGYAYDGNKEYYTCSCGKIFLDSVGKNETTLDDVTLKKTTEFVQKEFSTLKYCEYKPNLKDGDKVPLVLFLHGAGERGNDNNIQLKNAILEVVKKDSTSEFNKSVVIAPQCPSDIRWVDHDWAKGNYNQTSLTESEPLKLVSQLVKQYRGYDFIDNNRVYVVGVSMGGFGTWDLITRHQDLFTAAAPFCGGGPIDKVNDLVNFPIYTFHGDADNVVPYSGTKGMVDAIKEAGGKKIHFKSFSGSGHDIWNKAITYVGDNYSPSLENWLFSQNKDENADIKRIACVGDSLTYGHSWHNESYPVYLQEKLGDKYLVSNHGLNGANVTGFGGSGTSYKYTGTSSYTNSIKFSPDIITIMLGTNDATQWEQAKSTYETRYKELIESYQKVYPEAEIVLLTSPFTEENNNFNIPNENIGKYVYPLQMKIANDLRLPLIDIRKVFDTHENKSSLIRENDGVHLSVSGSILVADEIVKALKTGLDQYLIDYEYVNPDGDTIEIKDLHDFTQIDEYLD